MQLLKNIYRVCNLKGLLFQSVQFLDLIHIGLLVITNGKQNKYNCPRTIIKSLFNDIHFVFHCLFYCQECLKRFTHPYILYLLVNHDITKQRHNRHESNTQVRSWAVSHGTSNILYSYITERHNLNAIHRTIISLHHMYYMFCLSSLVDIKIDRKMHYWTELLVHGSGKNRPL